MVNKLPPILEVAGVLISSDILTEEFCCDLEVCKGACCIEGDAGAPVTLDEVMEIENHVEGVWSKLSASAQAVLDKQGVAYTDALNYHQWDICKCGREKGKALHLPVYQFLKGPLVRRFGEQWYQELCDVASDLKQQGYL